jgi:alpha-glucoside transport system substrate-binding protein
MFRKASWIVLTLLIALSMILSACAPAASPEEPAAEQPAVEEPAAVEPPVPAGPELTAAWNGEYAGTVVTMDGPFGGPDLVKFENSIKEFEEITGIDIQYQGSKEFEANIAIRIEGGDAPDIVDFPQPGLLGNLVKKGYGIDLNTVINQDWLKQNYTQSWLDMGIVEGPNGPFMMGIWARVNAKSLVWYPKAQFDAAGYQVPETWDEMIALTEEIAADGDAAWCIGIESGAATGWAMTDWVEEMMLRTTTPENYDKWVTGELKFDSPEVRKAVEYVTQIWFNDDYVFGGRASIPTKFFGDAPQPMFEDPPKCWLHRQGNFITTFFPEGLVAGEDYDFFYFPPVGTDYGRPVLVAGDIYAMFNDRPEVRAVIQWFTTALSLKEWLASGGAISPHNDSELDWYPPNSMEQKMAEMISAATAVRFDGSDLMPGEVGAGSFWKYMTDYVSGAIDLDTALSEIDAGWPK